jgi:hypothetical protein
MPERLNICCLFDQVPSDRRLVFSKLFAVGPSLTGWPSKFMVLNIETGMMSEGNWPLPDSVAQQVLDQDILFVYSDWATSPVRFRSSISLNEANGRAVYTLSFPALLLQKNTTAAVERQFSHIHEIATSIGKCSTLIGPELELDTALSAKNAITSALDPASLATWIISPEEYLPSNVQPFDAVKIDETAVLLRHPTAAQRVGTERN